MTSKTNTSDAQQVADMFREMWGLKRWFYVAKLNTDDLGVHVDLYVDLPAAKEDGFVVPGAPLGVKVCVMSRPPKKA